jgi:proteic killer suppression protein
MDIIFNDSGLFELASDYKSCIRAMGAIRSKKLFVRLNAIKDAADLNELKSLPGRFHPLTGNRIGDWACDLDHPYRLIFRPILKDTLDFSMSFKSNNQFVSILILEITDYH